MTAIFTKKCWDTHDKVCKLIAKNTCCVSVGPTIWRWWLIFQTHRILFGRIKQFESGATIHRKRHLKDNNCLAFRLGFVGTYLLIELVGVRGFLVNGGIVLFG